VGKRHRRIRARSATGQVAGAATEKPGLNTPIAQTGLPNMRSPKEPLSRSADHNPARTRTTTLERHFHAPNSSSAALSQARERGRDVARRGDRQTVSQAIVALGQRGLRTR
jgi:hypothetical protein